ncbi:MAG: HlyC/CorC family transporter [Acidobacteria bacterium]|nr:HlyC/CorC family transporter [Acidobacteriota bacterium]
MPSSPSTPTWLIALLIGLLLYRSALAMMLSAHHALTSLQRRRLLEEEAIRDPELAALLERPHVLGMGLSLVTQFLLVALLVLSWPLKEAIPGGWASLAVLTLAFLWGLDMALPTILTAQEPGLWLARIWPIYAPIHPIFDLLVSPLARRLERRRAEADKIREGEDEPVSEDAVTALIEEGEAEGILEESDSELIRNVVSFGDTVVREVMTPRTRIKGLSGEATVAEAWQAFMQSRHARLPVFDGAIDHPLGLLLLKDLMQLPDQDPRLARDLCKPVLFVPESKPVSELMKDMQRQRAQLAMVVDEFGAVSGLVSMEDLLEEVFGEIRDEHEGAMEIQTLADGSLLASGQSHVDDVAAQLGLSWEHEGFDTVGGLVMSRLGRVPKPQDRVAVEGATLTVLRMEGTRILQVKVEPLP